MKIFFHQFISAKKQSCVQRSCLSTNTFPYFPFLFHDGKDCTVQILPYDDYTFQLIFNQDFKDQTIHKMKKAKLQL